MSHSNNRSIDTFYPAETLNPAKHKIAKEEFQHRNKLTFQGPVVIATGIKSKFFRLVPMEQFLMTKYYNTPIATLSFTIYMILLWNDRLCTFSTDLI